MSRIQLVLILLFLGSGLPGQGQVKEITALRGQADAATDSVQRMKTFVRLGKMYVNRSLDSCYYFSASALELAKRIDDK